VVGLPLPKAALSAFSGFCVEVAVNRRRCGWADAPQRRAVYKEAMWVPPPELEVVIRGNRCLHNRIIKKCPDCSNCGHGKIKQNCGICNDCGHGKVKANCKICGGCEHGKVKKNCRDCKGGEVGPVYFEDWPSSKDGCK